MLVVAVAGRGGSSSRVDMAGLLVLAGGTVMVSGDAIPMCGAEATRDPFTLDGGAELSY
jgi:hypothetical protein